MSHSDSNEPGTTRRPEISDEKIAGLLRLTGARPAVPGDRALRVKAAVRAQWRAGIRARRRARAVAALAAAAALAVVAGLMWRAGAGKPPAQAPMARVEAVTGVATMGPMPGRPGGPGSPRAIGAGHEVTVGSRIETGVDGLLALRLSSGASLRLDAGTRVAFDSLRSLTLEAGAVYVDSGAPGAPAGPANIEIHTPAGRVREIGTQFEVRLIDAAVRLRVREGIVTVDRPAGSLEVRPGRELRVDG